jgi:hypothetical protein
MAFLYINSKGQPWRKHSYSAGNVFDQCPKKYYLQKVLGWREKDNKARFQFGKALETAIQHHHEHNGQGAVARFMEEWAPYKDNRELQYTRVERDWPTLLRTGIEMLKLYIIRQSGLPIPMGGQTVFQREFSKEVFPNDPNYGEIEDAGKLDIVAYVDPNHLMLPKLNWKPEYGAFRPVIVDIKTAGADFPDVYGIAAYDTQLRRYSWLSGIRDVALLWFVKKGHSLEKGSSVTLLEDAGVFKAAQEAVVAQVDGDDVILVANDFMIEEMEKAQGKKPNKKGEMKTDQTNEAKARRDAWLEKFGARVPSEIITKQRLQFNAGYVSIESANEAGAIAADQIVRIVNEWSKKARGDQSAYYNKFGIRYPHDDRSDPYFRAFILGDEAFRNSNFTKSDDETLDDLFADESEVE